MEPRPPSLTDGHQEVLQVPRHLALDALLQRLLADVLVLDQSCQRHVGEIRFFFCGGKANISLSPPGGRLEKQLINPSFMVPEMV